MSGAWRPAVAHYDSRGAPGHRSGWQLIRRRTFLREEGGRTIEIDNAIFRLMLVPNNPSSPDLNEGYDQLLAEASPTVVGPQSWSQASYLAMEDEEKSAFLNIDPN